MEHEQEALRTIYQNLKNGQIYAHYMENVRFPMYYAVLSYDRVKNLFHWRHFGSSANKATKKELAWIIETIFKTTPVNFMIDYDCVDSKAYNRQFS